MTICSNNSRTDLEGVCFCWFANLQAFRFKKFKHLNESIEIIVRPQPLLKQSNNVIQSFAGRFGNVALQQLD